jgi:hypothetical protein
MKLCRPILVLLIGTFFSISSFSQTTTNTIPVKPVSNSVQPSNPSNSGVKMVEKKKRKPCQVTCVKKHAEANNTKRVKK